MNKKLLLVFVLFYLNSIQAQTVTTLAGSTKGDTDGAGTVAQFNNPTGIAVDALGNAYVADYVNHKIKKITYEGLVTTFAGSTSGFVDGIGSSAQFYFPSGVAIDASGNIFVADSGNSAIRKITKTGVVSTLAGGATLGSADGIGTAAQFNNPSGVATDASGNIYVADYANNKIRKISTSGVVTTLAGSINGDADGIGSAAKFNYPFGVATDVFGNVYVAEHYNRKIRKITASGVVTTLAGSTYGYADGAGATAQFRDPRGVATDGLGNVYVADSGNNIIRKITASGEVSTIAGSTQGYLDGVASVAKFNYPFAIAVDAVGNVYVVDWYNQKIRKFTLSLAVNQNNAASFSIRIYPNPTTKLLNIQLEEVDANTQLSIVDILGKIIYKQTLENALTTINTNNYAKGIYFLTIQQKDKKTTRKFMVE